MERKRPPYSMKSYQHYARNPFIDKKTLQFVKKHTSTPDTDLPDNESGYVKKHRSAQKPVMSEEAAKLIAAAIRGLLNG